MDKKTKILTFLLIVLVIVSIIFAYKRFFIDYDYEVYSEETSDLEGPSEENIE